MKGRPRVPREALLLGAGTISMPLWPDFVAMASVTPPGVSVVPMPAIVGDLVLCIIAASMIFLLLARERFVPALAPHIAAYEGSWILASLLGFDVVTGLLTGLALVMGAAFHAGIAAWRDRPHVLRTIYATFFVSGTLVSLLGAGMVFLRRPAPLYAMVHGRATSTFVVPGEFAAYLLLLLATAVGVLMTDRSRFLRGWGLAALLSGALALGMTYSRAGWLGAAAGTAFFLYMVRRQAGKTRMHALFVAVAPVIVFLIAFIPLFHGRHNPSEDYVRLPIWQAGLRALELFPLTGTGPASFRHVYPLLRPIAGEPVVFHVHNVILTALAETGILGTATLAIVWFSFIRLFRERLRAAEPTHRTLASAIAAGLVATWAQGMLDYVQIVVLGCWLPFMALALAAAESGIPDS